MSNYTIAEIDLSVLKNNINIISSIVKKTKILNILKANAYGHGIIEIAKASEKFKVDAIGVATVEEGIKIRKSGVKIPIIVLFQHFKSEFEEICNYNLSPTISNADFLPYYDNYMERFKDSLKLNVYIKIDTGLNRRRHVSAYVSEKSMTAFMLSDRNIILYNLNNGKEKDRINIEKYNMQNAINMKLNSETNTTIMSVSKEGKSAVIIYDNKLKEIIYENFIDGWIY